MVLFGQQARPSIVWRNPAMPHGTRRANYCDTVPGGRKYEVIEQARPGAWVVVTVLTVLDGRTKFAAA